MPHLDGEGLALVLIGLVSAIAAPFLSNVQVNLPPPRTKFARRVLTIAGEALACVFILGGIISLLGRTPFSDMLQEAQVIIATIFIMLFLGAMFIDPVIFREENEKREADEK